MFGVFTLEYNNNNNMAKFAVTTKECLVRSTNLEKVAVNLKHKGKKPGQRKGKLCKQTLSLPKRKKTYKIRTGMFESVTTLVIFFFNFILHPVVYLTLLKDFFGHVVLSGAAAESWKVFVVLSVLDLLISTFV